MGLGDARCLCAFLQSPPFVIHLGSPIRAVIVPFVFASCILWSSTPPATLPTPLALAILPTCDYPLAISTPSFANRVKRGTTVLRILPFLEKYIASSPCV